MTRRDTERTSPATRDANSESNGCVGCGVAVEITDDAGRGVTCGCSALPTRAGARVTLTALTSSERDDVRRLALVAVEARALLLALVGTVPDGGDLDALRRDVDAAFAAALDDARRELARCATTDVRRALDRRVRTLDAAATQWHVAMRALIERLRVIAESGVSL